MESQFTISSLIVIVWLIFPGVISKRFYFQGQFTKQFGIGLFADRLITSIFWGILVQIIAFLIYSRSFGFTFTGIKTNVELLYGKISENKIPDVPYEHILYILGYSAALILTAILLGTIFHHIIRYFKIDLKYPVFRFSNHWNYYFRGEIISMKEFRSLNKGKWLSTMVDVIIEDGTPKNKMVSGFLTQHTISPKTGDLETIYLTNARRFSQTTQTFKDVPGDCMVIPFAKVIDLNLRYTFQILTPQQRREALFRNGTNVWLSVGFVLIIICPWMLTESVFNTILGIIFGLISWLLLTIIAFSPFDPNQQQRPKIKDLIISSIITIIILVFTFYFWGFLPLHP